MSATRSIEPDFVQALHWNELAAKAGNASAQVRLGFQYATGQGVEHCIAQAGTGSH